MRKILLSVFTVIALTGTVFACSDFVIKAKDGTVVEGRSMEFPIDLHSRLWVVPRGEKHECSDNKGRKGLFWTSKYGYFGIDAYGIKDGYVDGFNEKGLSISGLAFGTVKYQEPVQGKFVTWNELGDWVLGNFASVSEVKAALKNTLISDNYISKIKGNMGMHFAVHDASGSSIVAEIVNGKLNVYDNPIGVMTNRPDFPWQLDNLRNFVNLNPTDKDSRMVNGVRISSTGVGSGMVGLPGDWTPPSRFVKLAFSIDAVLKPKKGAEAFNTAEHLLNVVDIPKGAIKEHPAPFVTIYGYAQWVVIKDLTNKVMYFRTYEDTSWRSADLKKFNLGKASSKACIAMQIPGSPALDVSSQFK